MGELSKLLLGAEPARALRLARDTGVLVELLPEFGPAIGFDQESRYHDLTVDEHTFAVVQAAADQGFSLPCGSPRSSTTSASRSSAGAGTTGASTTTRSPASPPTGTTRSAPTSRRGRCSGSGIRTRCGGTSSRIVRRHMFQPGKGDARRARRFLRRNGDELAFDLIDHKHADLLGKRGSDGEPPPLEEIERLAASARWSSRSWRARTGCATSPIDGNDLIELGFRPGPQLGHILHDLLDAVVDEPALNTRDELLARAKERL